MRTVSASARARVQSRLSTAAAAAAFLSSALREVGIAFLPETASSFLRLSYFSYLVKYLKDASESQHAALIRMHRWRPDCQQRVHFHPPQSDGASIDVRAGLHRMPRR